MGCCCSCLKGEGASSSSQNSETEMTRSGGAAAQPTKSMSLSRAMSAPTVDLESPTVATGYGLVLAGVNIEQDAAYWEWHVNVVTEDNESCAEDVMFGVATRKDRAFYRAQEDNEGDEIPESNGTELMRKVPVRDGDTVGVAVQQSDLPMIQFLVNGEPRHDLAINRFRGAVYPSLFLPAQEEGHSVKAALVLDENGFRYLSPNARFGPVIVARGLI